MEAKRVAAQLQLMAKQLDRLAGHVLSEVKNFKKSSISYLVQKLFVIMFSLQQKKKLSMQRFVYFV